MKKIICSGVVLALGFTAINAFAVGFSFKVSAKTFYCSGGSTTACQMEKGDDVSAPAGFVPTAIYLSSTAKAQFDAKNPGDITSTLYDADESTYPYKMWTYSLGEGPAVGLKITSAGLKAEGDESKVIAFSATYTPCGETTAVSLNAAVPIGATGSTCSAGQISMTFDPSAALVGGYIYPDTYEGTIDITVSDLG